MIDNTLTKSHEICEYGYLALHTSTYKGTAQGKTWNFPKNKNYEIYFYVIV